MSQIKQKVTPSIENTCVGKKSYKILCNRLDPVGGVIRLVTGITCLNESNVYINMDTNSINFITFTLFCLTPPLIYGLSAIKPARTDAIHNISNPLLFSIQ